MTNNEKDWLIKHFNMIKFAFYALSAKNEFLEEENNILKNQLKEKDEELKNLQSVRRK